MCHEPPGHNHRQGVRPLLVQTEVHRTYADFEAVLDRQPTRTALLSGLVDSTAPRTTSSNSWHRLEFKANCSRIIRLSNTRVTATVGICLLNTSD